MPSRLWRPFQPRDRSCSLIRSADTVSAGCLGLDWRLQRATRDRTDCAVRVICPRRSPSLQRSLADHGLVFTPSRARLRRGEGDPIIEPGFAGVRRLDLTVDLAFKSPAEGIATMAGVAAMTYPRLGKRVQFQPGGRAVETVYLLGSAGRRVLGRFYGKGVESGAAARGTLLRPEDQRRFSGKARLPLEAVDPATIRGLFQRRFLPLWKATEGITVGTSPQLARRLVQLVEQGQLSHTQARTLLGHLIADDMGVEETWASPRSLRRYRALAREHGLVLAGGVIESCEVDLHDVVEAALEAKDWYAGVDG
jgi:hypothetical protein